jgi:hypothetical protein
MRARAPQSRVPASRMPASAGASFAYEHEPVADTFATSATRSFGTTTTRLDRSAEEGQPQGHEPPSPSGTAETSQIRLVLVA